MTGAELLAHLRRRDVKLSVASGRLRCDSPKGVMTPALRQALAEHKAELLALLSGERTASKEATPELVPRPRTGDLPLSFSQERLWFLHQLDPDSPAYNIHSALRIGGSLQVAALERAISEIVARHEIFRTTCARVGGRLVQAVAPSLAVPLPVDDLADIAEDELESEVVRRAAEEARQPFDLARGPLLRTRLLRLGRDRHVLLLTTHNFVADGWSMQVFNSELSALYRAFVCGEPSPLPPLPLQYADFAVWQREWLQGDVLRHQLSYWRSQLAGAAPLTELPVDRPRPVTPTYRGAREPFALSEPLSDSLRELGRHEGVTLFMVLLAAFQTLLHRYSGQREVLVWTPVTNRNRTETEGMIGPFANSVALRTCFAGDPTFRELLGRVRQVAVGAFAHQDLPFEKLLQELPDEGAALQRRGFQVMVVLYHGQGQRLELADLSVSRLAVEQGTATFDLLLAVGGGGRALAGVLHYSTDLFDAATIRRLLGQFEGLLEAVVSDPGIRVSRLPLLTEGERQRRWAAWNDTRVEHLGDPCLQDLFDAQVQRHPDRVAVEAEDRRLTYAELSGRADQVARSLRSLGVDPETPVGLHLERSVETIVGVLGILKAGGICVPLDPRHPAPRLQAVLDDASPPVMVTLERHIEGLAGYGGRVCVLDASQPAIPGSGGQTPARNAHADQVAWLTYSWGTRPAGTLVTHRALCNQLRWLRRTFDLAEDDRVLRAPEPAPDVPGWEDLGALLAGARLVLASAAGGTDAGQVLQTIRARAITTLVATPALLHALLEDPAFAACPSLRRVVCRGEGLTGELSERFAAIATARLHAVYGLPEAGVEIATARCGGPTGRWTVPADRPGDNVQIHVLDGHLNPVPTGAVGGLYVGGQAVPRGYWGKPGRTAERFLPDPFGESPGARLFDTGELARFVSDGTLDILGRPDRQVKVRGYRVGLAGIETLLAQHPQVQAALALPMEDPLGGERWAAYVVADPPAAGASAAVRGFLRERLPEPMLPSAVVSLDSFPFTAAGEIDDRSLPRPESRPHLDGSFRPPRTEAERTLAEIWRELLKLDEVGVDENFFDLGGHSLLVMQAIAKFEQRTGVRLNPADFLHGTLGQLAASRAAEEPEGARGQPGQPLSDRGEPFLFGPRQAPLFGFHRPADAPRPRGAVLCSPVGPEYLRCHRAYRELARRLVRAGYHVLTFDYYGCGDSSGLFQEARLARWQADTARAVEALKGRLRTERVCLVGLRLGGSLAFLAAAGREDIDALVLWEPVVRGATLVRELLTLQGPGHSGAPPYARPDGTYDVLGYPLSAALLEDLEALDLGAVRSGAPKQVLVVENGELDRAPGGPAVTGLRRFVETLGRRAEHRRISEARIWLREPYEAIVPQETLRSIVGWISDVCP